MKLAELVSFMTEVTGLPETTVAETARSLQKAKLVQVGKPGRYGGAKMSARDATSLALAMIAAGERREVTQAHRMVEEIGFLQKHMHLAFGDPRNSPSEEQGQQVSPEFDFWQHQYGEEERRETLGDYLMAIIKRPAPPVPDPYQLTGYYVSVHFPKVYATLSYFTADTSKVGDGENRRMFQITFRDPKNPVSEPNPYTVTRTLHSSFFFALNAALFSED